MKSRNGSAAIVIFVAVLVLAAVGAIAWMHYSAQSNATAQNVSTSMVATTTQSPTTMSTTTATQSATSSATTVAATSQNCSANNLSCFIAAARTCSIASVEWTLPLNLFGLIETSQSHLAITGGTVGACVFSVRLDSASISISSSTEAQLEAKGTTAAQIQQQLEQSNTEAQQTIGTITKCTFTGSYLAKVLTQWSEGNSNTSDLPSSECKITPSASIAAQETKSTVYLTAGETIGINGVKFQVNSLTPSQLVVTITDTTTGQSQAEAFNLGNPITVFGHVMTLTTISQVNNGEQATLTYN